MTFEPGPDWDAIEREYRAGQLSNRELARVYGVSEAAIRKRSKGDARRPRWVRDLAPLVRAETERRLAEAAADKPAPRVPVHGGSTRDIVDAAALRGAEIILAHRTHIVGLRDRVTELATAYDTLTARLTATAEADDIKEHRAAYSAMANGLEQLLGVSGTLINLERQAFNLDGGGEADKPAGSALSQEQRAAVLRNLRARMATEGTQA